MACPNLGDCALFPQFVLRQNLRFWQKHFCEADYEECVRYELRAAGKPVPETLLPNGKQLRVTLRKLDVVNEDE